MIIPRNYAIVLYHCHFEIQGEGFFYWQTCQRVLEMQTPRSIALHGLTFEDFAV